MRSKQGGSRRFTIADAMILVGATAAGLAWSGRAWGQFTRAELGARASFGERAWEVAIRILVVVLPCLVAWTITLPFLRARRPGPRWRKGALQPGTTACLAGSLGLLLFAPFVVVVLLYQGGSQHGAAAIWNALPAASLEMLSMAVPPVGFGVLVAWGVLALQRRWRCDPGWIDRAGRAVGTLWIVSAGVLGTFFLRQFLR